MSLFPTSIGLLSLSDECSLVFSSTSPITISASGSTISSSSSSSAIEVSKVLS